MENNITAIIDTLSNKSQELVTKDFVDKYKQLQKLKAEIDAAETLIKSKLVELFESEDVKNNDIKSVVANGLKFTYIKPSVRKTVDGAKLKEEYPEIYKKMLKESNVKGSIRTKITD